jgi:hypothetical protein
MKYLKKFTIFRKKVIRSYQREFRKDRTIAEQIFFHCQKKKEREREKL